MPQPNSVTGIWARATRWLDTRLEQELRHRRRAQRLEAHSSEMWRAVARAAYVAVLEREPDEEGLRFNGGRLQRGYPLEALLAELALARDAEETGTLAGLATYADATRDEVHVLEERIAAYEQRTREDAEAQRRTLLALTRRLAAIEDRLAGGEESPASPAASAAGH